MEKLKILFVCMGNICRSPAAEGILKKKVHEAGLDDRFEIDSAGMYGYHEGELPNPRMRKQASARGYELTSRSRTVRTDDFYRFDRIVGMDDVNIHYLMSMAPDDSSRQKICCMTDFCRIHRADHVPDPYYGDSSDFDHVLDLLEDACDGIVEKYT
ncbi:MAG: low molecular weight phosphotyrosine protein phosphatase [Tannerella sp.]|jgi:protein-tyrosine phosphatase|nr:low molecular weight phosphotyrosine protein phosphatase [Tannerella sp.]